MSTNGLDIAYMIESVSESGVPIRPCFNTNSDIYYLKKYNETVFRTPSQYNTFLKYNLIYDSLDYNLPYAIGLPVFDCHCNKLQHVEFRVLQDRM